MGLSGTMLSQCFKWSFIMFPILNWLFTRFHSVHFVFQTCHFRFGALDFSPFSDPKRWPFSNPFSRRLRFPASWQLQRRCLADGNPQRRALHESMHPPPPNAAFGETFNTQLLDADGWMDGLMVDGLVIGMIG